MMITIYYIYYTYIIITTTIATTSLNAKNNNISDTSSNANKNERSLKFCENLFSKINFSSTVEVYTTTITTEDGAKYPFWIRCLKATNNNNNNINNNINKLPLSKTTVLKISAKVTNDTNTNTTTTTNTNNNNNNNNNNNFYTSTGQNQDTKKENNSVVSLKSHIIDGATNQFLQHHNNEPHNNKTLTADLSSSSIKSSIYDQMILDELEINNHHTMISQPNNNNNNNYIYNNSDSDNGYSSDKTKQQTSIDSDRGDLNNDQYIIDVAKTCENYISKKCQSSKIGLLTQKSSECPTCGLGDLNCDNLHHCSSDCGQIKSVNYPLSYPNNHRCRWSIKAPEKQYVNLSVIDFDIPSSTNASKLGTCTFDYLTLIDGQSGKRLGGYCNENLPPPFIISPWNELIIQFNTNRETTGRGFYFHYKFKQLELTEEVKNQLDNDKYPEACKKGWQYYERHCYKAYFEHENLQWHDAEDRCKQRARDLDGHLVSILDKDEMLAVHYMLINIWKSPRNKDFYIGLVDQHREGIYRWIDNKSMSYTDWQIKPILIEDDLPAQPDGGAYEDCTIIKFNSLSQTSNWHDIPCSLGKSRSRDSVDSYICKTNCISGNPGCVLHTDRRALFSNEFIPPGSSQSTNPSDMSVPMPFERWSKLATLDENRYFQCDNLEVINIVLRCDGRGDCRDSSDENNGCYHDCLDWQYRCNNGRCISYGYYCDFVDDCGDGSDESHCGHRCKLNEFRCQNGQCIPMSQRCDLITDCRDGTDEGEICNIGSKCNPDNTFQCYYGNCIPNEAVCDFQIDCPGKFHEDEDAATCDEKMKRRRPVYNYYTALADQRSRASRMTGYELLLSRLTNYTKLNDCHNNQDDIVTSSANSNSSNQPVVEAPRGVTIDSLDVANTPHVEQTVQANTNTRHTQITIDHEQIDDDNSSRVDSNSTEPNTEAEFCIRVHDKSSQTLPAIVEDIVYVCKNHTLRHCHDLYHHHGVIRDGYYDVQPDPFDKTCPVECKFKKVTQSGSQQKTLIATTLVHHDSEFIVHFLPKTTTSPINVDTKLTTSSGTVLPPSTSVRNPAITGQQQVITSGSSRNAGLQGNIDFPVSYDSSIDIILALISQSRHCQQSIYWKCFTQTGHQVTCLDQLSTVSTTNSTARARSPIRVADPIIASQNSALPVNDNNGLNFNQQQSTYPQADQSLNSINSQALHYNSGSRHYGPNGMNVAPIEISTINLTSKNLSQLQLHQDHIHVFLSESIQTSGKQSGSSPDSNRHGDGANGNNKFTWSHMIIRNKTRLPIVKAVFKSQIQIVAPLEQHHSNPTASPSLLAPQLNFNKTPEMPIRQVVYRIGPLECSGAVIMRRSRQMSLDSAAQNRLTSTEKNEPHETTRQPRSSDEVPIKINGDDGYGQEQQLAPEGVFRFGKDFIEGHNFYDELDSRNSSINEDDNSNDDIDSGLDDLIRNNHDNDDMIGAIPPGSGVNVGHISSMVGSTGELEMMEGDDDPTTFQFRHPTMHNDYIDYSNNNNDDSKNGHYGASYHTISSKFAHNRVLEQQQYVEAVCEPKKQEYFRCKSGHLVNNTNRCILEYDRYGYLTGCRDVTHLIDCHEFECPPRDYVKCHNSYCIPTRYICDGKADCMDREDELDCSKFTCPGQYKCYKSHTCISIQQLCDKLRQCPMGDDEWFCDLTCPKQCDCIGQSIDCRKANLNSLPSNYIFKSVRKLDLSYNRLGPNLSDADFSAYLDLGELILQHNGIEVLIPRKFAQLRNLDKLDLSNNQIHSVKRGAFAGLRRVTKLLLESNPELVVLEPEAFLDLRSLKMLNISSSRIHIIKRKTFVGLTSLRQLLLRSNLIVEIEDGAFRSLDKLISLDMRGNDIRYFTKTVFSDLKSLRNLSTDAFKFCCLMSNRVPAVRCLPLPDEISDCEDLMGSVLQRSCIWAIGVIACFGNCIVIIWRYREHRKVNSTLLLSLGCSDLLMGIYLIMIAGVDVYYRGRYIENADNWRQSFLCNVCGFLSTVSSEASVFTLVLIALNRCFEICKPLNYKYKFTMRWTLRLISISWLSALIIAVLPLIIKPYFRDGFYSRSGVCLSFHITNQKPAGWEYSIAIHLCVNLVAFIIIVACYTAITIKVKRASLMSRQFHDKTIKSIRTYKIAAIVLANFACWSPTIIMSGLSLLGVKFPAAYYSWIAVFFLPVNSAINPMIYTIPTIRESLWKLINNHPPSSMIKHYTFSTKLHNGLREHFTDINRNSKQYSETKIKLNMPPGYKRLNEYIIEDRDKPLEAIDLLKILYNIAQIIQSKHSVGQAYGTITSDNIFVSDTVIAGQLTIYLPDYDKFQTKREFHETTDIKQFGSVIRDMLQLYTIQRDQKSSSSQNNTLRSVDNFKLPINSDSNRKSSRDPLEKEQMRCNHTNE